MKKDERSLVPSGMAAILPHGSDGCGMGDATFRFITGMDGRRTVVMGTGA